MDDLVAAVRARAARDAEAPSPFDIARRQMGRVETKLIELVGMLGPPDRRPPRRPPCSDADVDAAEVALGMTLPPLLRRLYTEVGDGGFGPGDGIFGVDRLPEEWHDHAVELAEGQELGEWPEGLLPLCMVDQTLLACVDCRDPSGPIVGLEFDEIDFDEAEGFDEAFSPLAPSLEAWLRAWVDEAP